MNLENKSRKGLIFFIIIVSLFLFFLLLSGICFLTANAEYSRKMAEHEELSSTDLSHLSVNEYFLGQPLGYYKMKAIVDTEDKSYGLTKEYKHYPDYDSSDVLYIDTGFWDDPILVKNNGQEIKTASDVETYLGTDYYVDPDYKSEYRIYADKANHYVLHINIVDGIVKGASIGIDHTGNYDRNYLQSGASVFSIYSYRPDGIRTYHFFLNTWPRTVYSRVSKLEYLYWLDYILIPFVLTMSLLPIIAILVFRKWWLFLLGILFYMVYAFLWVFSVILYT